MIRVFASLVQFNDNGSNSAIAQVKLLDPVGNSSTAIYVEVFGCDSIEQVRQTLMAACRDYAVNTWSIVFAPNETILLIGV